MLRERFFSDLRQRLAYRGVKEDDFQDFYQELEELLKEGELDPFMNEHGDLRQEKEKPQLGPLYFFYEQLLPKTSYSAQDEEFMLRLVESEAWHLPHAGGWAPFSSNWQDELLVESVDFQLKAVKVNYFALWVLLDRVIDVELKVVLKAMKDWVEVLAQKEIPVWHRSDLEIVTSLMAANPSFFCNRIFGRSAREWDRNHYSARYGPMQWTTNKEPRKKALLERIAPKVIPGGDRQTLKQELKKHPEKISDLASDVKKVVGKKRSRLFSLFEERRDREKEKEEIYIFFRFHDPTNPSDVFK